VTVVPLPVELITFKGHLFNNRAEIQWETAWERDASHFEVQRSTDLKEFITLQTLQAAGDTRERTRYTYIDPHPLPDVGYYRLRQIDRDGTFMYSKTISIINDSEVPQIWLYENPTSHIHLRLHKLQPTDLQLFSWIGQTISTQWEATSTNDYWLQTRLPSGSYWLVGQYNGRKVSQKIRVVSQ